MFEYNPSKKNHQFNISKHPEDEIKCLTKEGDNDPLMEDDLLFIPDEFDLKVSVKNSDFAKQDTQNADLTKTEQIISTLLRKSQKKQKQQQTNKENILPFQYNQMEMDETSGGKKILLYSGTKINHKLGFSQKDQQQAEIQQKVQCENQKAQIVKQKKLKNNADLNQNTQQNQIKKSQKKTLQKPMHKHQSSEVQEFDLCTFAPKINNRPNSNNQQRSLNQFLRNQDMHQDKVNNKNRLLQEQLTQQQQEGVTLIPQINKNSKALSSNPNNQNQKAFQRLYQKKQTAPPEDIVNDLAQIEAENTFVPRIQQKSKNIIRSEPVQNLLYQDAIRRNEIKNHIVTQLSQKQRNNKRFVLTNTEKILITKFIKEYELGLQTVAPKIFNPSEAQNPLSNNFKIDYLTLSELLKFLGFININDSYYNTKRQANVNEEQYQIQSVPPVSKERTLVYDLWKVLCGEKYSGVSKRNLCIFLLAVLGLFCEIPKVQQPNTATKAAQKQSENNNQNGLNSSPSQNQSSSTLHYQDSEFSFTKNTVGNFDSDGDWALPFEEGKVIQQEFDLFYRTRLQNEELRKAKDVPNYSFEPGISVVSTLLAENYRKKLLDKTAHLIENNEIHVTIPQDGIISHADLLTLQKLGQMNDHRKQQKLQSQKEVEQCTFQPSTGSIQSASFAKHLGGISQQQQQQQQQQLQCHHQNIPSNSSLHLYNTKPHRSDKTKEEVEYERNAAECTFHPTLLQRHPNQLLSHPSALLNKKEYDKTIDRLRMARQEREMINQFKERGYPHNLSIHNANLSQISNQSHQNNALELLSYQSDNQNHSFTNNNNNHNMNDVANQDAVQQQATGHFKDKDALPPCNYDYGNEQVEDEDRVDEGHFTQNEAVPLLFVDVNLGPNRAERITVFEGDTALNLAQEFSLKHNLDGKMQLKLVELLNQQIEGLLAKIEEEQQDMGDSPGAGDNYQRKKYI